MLEDKIKATDWEATDEQIAELAARESYLQWLKDSQKNSSVIIFTLFPVGIYLLKVNNKNTRTTSCQSLFFNKVAGLGLQLY